MNMTDLEFIRISACEIIKSTGKFIKEEKDKITPDVVKSKGIHDFVSYVDLTAERKLVDGLKPLIPDAGFIAEEGTDKSRSEEYNWIIDPLDGTTNFIHGLSPFAISVALMYKSEIILGIIYEISLDECFWATKDNAAFLNGKIISVTETSLISGCLIATGFPYYDYSRINQFLGSLEFFMRNSHGVRRLGSAATDLAYVACGRFDAFYEYSLSPWDVAAGAFIVQQAGGKVSDFKGGDDYIFGKEIIASNNNVYLEFLSDIKSFFK